MLYDIKVVCQLGVDGVVFGCFIVEGYVDVFLMQKLMNVVGEMSVIFYCVFDMCSNFKEVLEQIIGLGIDWVFIFGQEVIVEKGIFFLKELVEQVDGWIIIMLGCGVNVGNICKIVEEIGILEFYFFGCSSVDSGMIYCNLKVFMGGIVKIEEYLKDVIDFDKVKVVLFELVMKDENDKVLEKKNKSFNFKKLKKEDDWDDEDDDLDDDK